MDAFARGETHVLVATTVIEVGVDVPNATCILIENAERFGLAQLHQLRGRVGRGNAPSTCLLVAEEESERLKWLEETTDGFLLAEKDWEMRGAGDLLGLRQSGSGQVELTALMQPQLVALAQAESRAIFADDPFLDQPEHALLARAIQQMIDLRSDRS
ncbi:MAG: hypothetical protein HC915_10780 [Anaerolineae bacterium]|nr:hypothetical protein [Anaerolineae bacterium]